MTLTPEIEFLRQMTEADIKRNGEWGSSMVRSGLLLEILDAATSALGEQANRDEGEKG